ncbi:hypothetical protein VNO77_03744 [Canavalia gladiata]|uniref:Uncharacterized protein n=1 Tax=Canavalia gladiata TaxID=3824 RepID=A0AAN9R475_CANGL
MDVVKGKTEYVAYAAIKNFVWSLQTWVYHLRLHSFLSIFFNWMQIPVKHTKHHIKGLRFCSICHGISSVSGKLGAMVAAFAFLYLA